VIESPKFRTVTTVLFVAIAIGIAVGLQSMSVSSPVIVGVFLLVGVGVPQVVNGLLFDSQDSSG